MRQVRKIFSIISTSEGITIIVIAIFMILGLLYFLTFSVEGNCANSIFGTHCWTSDSSADEEAHDLLNW